MTALRHLTEAERHDAADGTLAQDQQAGVAEHLAECEICAADVARVKALMTHIREAPMPSPADLGADLWPDIRARIEREKLIQLPASEAPAKRGLSGGLSRGAWLSIGLAAALIMIVVLQQTRGKGGVLPTSASRPLSAEVQLVADSTRTYEREASILLNELELRRALLPPQQRTSIDRDLKIIDQAILELKDAIARDPNNPALRRLLASSYKQKIDVLKRMGS